ncbi:MAG: FAD-dependent oxidoreductase [Lachnospiraceae bacterium]|nr:FAD-dependent oxidoreductase [Lachnospiraceae bacterium]
MKQYDKIILGAGIYGLYSAIKCGKAGQKVLVLECDSAPFARATYINQARVHMGYHYPRSLSTAVKSAHYFRRFHEDYGFAINDRFHQIYATSTTFSWTNAKAFLRFCKASDIKCEEVSPNLYFKEGMCDGAFLTEEDTYDAIIIRDYYINELEKLNSVEVRCNVRTEKIIKMNNEITVDYKFGERHFTATTGFLLNATYASTNQILDMIQDEGDDKGDFTKFKIKYEQCEIVLCDVNDKLKNIGLTVMDGPFFSIMPFGKTSYHSLTAVTFTPHVTSYDDLPSFTCQKGVSCSPHQLGNCNECENKPVSAWEHMSHLAMKYMKPEYKFNYKSSLYSMKPILKTSEIDDSRPTSIVINSEKPKIISVLSGKINTVYDLDEYLEV